MELVNWLVSVLGDHLALGIKLYLYPVVNETLCDS